MQKEISQYNPELKLQRSTKFFLEKTKNSYIFILSLTHTLSFSWSHNSSWVKSFKMKNHGNRSFWGRRKGIIYCRTLKSSNSFWILAMLIILVMFQYEFSHFGTWIICEPVMISVMRPAGSDSPPIWILIDLVGIVPIATGATGIAPIPTKDIAGLHKSTCIKPSAAELKYSTLSRSPWVSRPVTEHSFWYLSGWLNVLSKC